MKEQETTLKAQAIALKDGEEAAFRWATAQALGMKSGEAFSADVDARITKVFELQKAQEKAIKEQRAAEVKANKDKARDEAESKKLKSSALSISSGVEDPVEKLKRQKAEELEIIRQAEEAGLQLHQEYSVLRGEIDKKFAEQEAVAREAKFRAESETNELLLNSVEALGQASTNVLAGLLSGTMSAKEAMQSFASTILNEALGSLVQIGVQHVKNAVMKTTADQSAAVAAKSIQATNAALHTAAVAATVAELTSLAALGAFAATAAIPIVGPALAPAAAAGAAGIAAGLGAGAIASAPIAGARQFGGPVNAGSAYRVGEAGPEIYSSGGKNYMIPGENGKVIANDDMSSNGGGFSQDVTIINNANTSVSTEASKDGKQLKIFINEVANQISNNQGAIPRALRNGSNYQPKANR